MSNLSKFTVGHVFTFDNIKIQTKHWVYLLLQEERGKLSKGAGIIDPPPNRASLLDP